MAYESRKFMKSEDPFGRGWMCNYYISSVDCSVRIDSEIFSSWTSSQVGPTIPGSLLVTLNNWRPSYAYQAFARLPPLLSMNCVKHPGQ
jgi:hypothetical protein